MWRPVEMQVVLRVLVDHVQRSGAKERGYSFVPAAIQPEDLRLARGEAFAPRCEGLADRPGSPELDHFHTSAMAEGGEVFQDVPAPLWRARFRIVRNATLPDLFAPLRRMTMIQMTPIAPALRLLLPHRGES